jgi:hypothetical protein
MTPLRSAYAASFADICVAAFTLWTDLITVSLFFLNFFVCVVVVLFFVNRFLLYVAVISLHNVDAGFSFFEFSSLHTCAICA